MIGYKLLIEQAELLNGQQFTTGSFFNPVMDKNGDYFIFEVEVNFCTNNDFLWVKQLIESEYIKPVE
jgi:hypothetical protein